MLHMDFVSLMRSLQYSLLMYGIEKGIVQKVYSIHGWIVLLRILSICWSKASECTSVVFCFSVFATVVSFVWCI